MSQKFMANFVANIVLGVTLPSALVSGMSGCVSSDGIESTATADTSTALSGQLDAVPAAAKGVVDPGVRGGAPGAGTPIAGLNANQLALFNEGAFRATEIEATCDECSDVTPGAPIPPGSPPGTTNSAGLGARYNSNTCTLGCHSQPAIGGTSGFVNQSFAAAVAKGATNIVPFFETIDGPTREVRFLFNPDGTRDGGVHQKFSVRGRSDAPLCTNGQPDFDANRDNIALRIPTPLFGLGIMDSLPDVELQAHFDASAARRQALGISGHFGHNGNTGTITRFGWKAQNASITLFAGEAYNVEMGVTNELFPQSKVEDYNCNLGAEPNDVTRTGAPGTDEDFNNPLTHDADWMVFQIMMRFMDQPKPVAFNASATRGLQTFKDIGCDGCHTPSMTTRSGPTGPQADALKGITANLYSDIALHHMGATLADNVIQGDAGPDEFRSAPLWGVGQRIFFLHDGRTKSLVDAILAHFSLASAAHGNTPAYPASEANKVIQNFSALPATKQQDLVNFLRSL